MNGARFSLPLFHSCRHLKRVRISLLALFWFNGLWLYGASPYGLGRGDRGLVRIWALASRLVVWGRGVEWRFSSLIESRCFADLWGLQLLLLLLLLL